MAAPGPHLMVLLCIRKSHLTETTANRIGFNKCVHVQLAVRQSPSYLSMRLGNPRRS